MTAGCCGVEEIWVVRSRFVLGDGRGVLAVGTVRCILGDAVAIVVELGDCGCWKRRPGLQVLYFSFFLWTEVRAAM